MHHEMTYTAGATGWLVMGGLELDDVNETGGGALAIGGASWGPPGGIEPPDTDIGGDGPRTAAGGGVGPLPGAPGYWGMGPALEDSTFPGEGIGAPMDDPTTVVLLGEYGTVLGGWTDMEPWCGAGPGGGPDCGLAGSGLGIALDGRLVGAGGRGEAMKDGKADGGGTFARTELLPIEASERKEKK